MAKPFLWIALDGLKELKQDAIDDLDRVEGNFGFKVNLDDALWYGLMRVQRRFDGNRKIFIDAKMFNGQRTMASVFEMCAEAGYAAVNSHVLAGGDTSREGGWELKKAIQTFRESSPQASLEIYGVTILSHYGDSYTERMFGEPLIGVVDGLIVEAQAAGANGVILPGSLAQTTTDTGMKKVLTGYRPDWFKDDRHSESFKPDDLVGLKNYEIVCGSPIMKNKGMNPGDALRRVLEELPDLG